MASKMSLVKLSSQLQYNTSSGLSIEESVQPTVRRNLSFTSGSTRSPSPDVQEIMPVLNQERRMPRDLPPLPPDIHKHSKKYEKNSARLVPTPSDESNVLVNTLNADHMRASESFQGDSVSSSGTGLQEAGLDETSLRKAGLPKDAIDRLYRALHHYTLSFKDVIESELAQTPDGERLKASFVKEFGLLLSKVKTDIFKEEVFQEKVGSVNGQTEPPVRHESLEEDHEHDSVDLLLQAKGTFELRNQVLQRLLLEERSHSEDLQSQKVELEGKLELFQEGIEKEKTENKRLSDVLQRKVEESTTQQEWFDKTLQDTSQKLSTAQDTIRNMQSKVSEQERKATSILNEKQDLNTNLQERTQERDDLKQTVGNLKHEVKASKQLLKDQYEQFRTDIERVQELQTSFESAVSERDAARELYDHETNVNAALKEDIAKQEADKENLVHDIDTVNILLKKSEEALEYEKVVVGGLKEEIQRLGKCESDLADTKLNLSYALDMTEMMQRESEKQRLFTEDIWSSSKSSLENARRQKAELKDLNDKLEGKLRNQHDIILKMKTKGTKLEDRAVASEEQAEGLVKQYEVALDGRARAEAAAEELERNLKDVSKKNWKLEEKLEDYRSNLRDAKRQNTKLDAHIDMLNKKLQENLAREEKNDAKYKGEIKKQQATITNYKAKFEDMVPKLKQAEITLKNFEELQKKHTALITDCDKWQKLFQKSESENAELKAKGEELSTTSGDLAAQLQSSEKQVKLLKANKADNEQRIKNLLSDLQNVTRERDQLLIDLKDTGDRLASTEANLKYEHKNLLLVEEELANTQDKLTNSAADVEKLQLNKRNLDTKLRNLRIANEELQLKFENTMDRFHKERQAWLAAVNAVREEFNKMWTDIKDDLSSRVEVATVANQVYENLSNTSRLLSATSEFNTLDVIANFKERVKEEVTQIKIVTKKTVKQSKAASTLLKMRRAVEHKRKNDAEEEKSKQLEGLEKTLSGSGIPAPVPVEGSTKPATSTSTYASTPAIATATATTALPVLPNFSSTPAAEINNEMKNILMRREKQHLEETAQLKQRLENSLTQQEIELKRVQQLEEDIKSLEIEVERMGYQNDELQSQLSKKERANNQTLDEVNIRVEHLTLQLSNANRARIWREKYAAQLNDQLKRARYELVQLGRQPKLTSKCIQTQYCDLWSMNIIKPPEVNQKTRESWTANIEHVQEHIEIISLQKLVNLIAEIYGEKLRADLSATRIGKNETRMVEFVYDFFFDRYGLEELTMKHLNQIGASLIHHQENPSVHVFASLCGITGMHDSIDNVDTEKINANAIVASNFLFGINWESTMYALNYGLATLVPKIIPDSLYDTRYPLIHPLTKEFSFHVVKMPFMREILHVSKSDELYTQLADTDLGIPLNEEQLPQLYKILVEACDILKIDCPELFISGRDTWESCLLCPGTAKPIIILTSKLVETLKPRELQVVMAQQLLPLIETDLIPLVNACSLSNVASQLLLSQDVTRSQWDSSVLPTIIRLQQSIDLTADRIALIVAQDYDLVINTIMKLNTSSELVANQLDPQALLAQASAAEDAAQKFLGRYDEREKNLSVLTGSRKLYAATKSLECSSDINNIPHASLSMSLVSASNSLSMLRARELKRWASSTDYEDLMKGTKRT